MLPISFFSLVYSKCVVNVDVQLNCTKLVVRIPYKSTANRTQITQKESIKLYKIYKSFSIEKEKLNQCITMMLKSTLLLTKLIFTHLSKTINKISSIHLIVLFFLYLLIPFAFSIVFCGKLIITCLS